MPKPPPSQYSINQQELDAQLALRKTWLLRYLALKSEADSATQASALGALFQEMRLFSSATAYYQKALALGAPEPVQQQLALTQPLALAFQNQLKMPQTQACVSIIMLTYNQWQYTEACLEDLWQNTPEMQELILIDNASADGSGAQLKTFAMRDPERIQVVLNSENKGFAGGCNQGLALAKNDHILLLNNDVLFTPGWLGRLLLALESQHLDLVGPMASNISGFQAALDIPAEMLAESVVRNEYALQRGMAFESQIQKTHRLAGTCLLLRRRVLDKIGGFDLGFGPGNFEDDDFCYRALLAGFQMAIAKDSFIHHFGGKSFEVLPQNTDQLKAHNAQYFCEKWGIKRPWPPNYLREPFPEIVSSGWHQALFIPLTP